MFVLVISQARQKKPGLTFTKLFCAVNIGQTCDMVTQLLHYCIPGLVKGLAPSNPNSSTKNVYVTLIALILPAGSGSTNGAAQDQTLGNNVRLLGVADDGGLHAEDVLERSLHPTQLFHVSGGSVVVAVHRNPDTSRTLIVYTRDGDPISRNQIWQGVVQGNIAIAAPRL